MALSRPLLNFARKFSTSSIRSSGAHGDHGTKQWKLGTYLVAIPVVVLATLYNFAMEHEHPHRPEFAKYEYMRTRNKGYPWGDGQHSLFHNPAKNALPDGYEEEDAHQSPMEVYAVLFRK